MSETIKISDIEIEVNTDAVEPSDYFKILKGKIKNVSEDDLKSQLSVIGEQLIAARNIGQQTFLEKLAFTWETILKEQILLKCGITQYVYKDDIKYFLDNIKPQNSIKIIELERYPRAIPLDVLHRVNDVKSKNIFDEFCVVFTDFTSEKYQSEEDKKVIERNKDPIIFGYFKQKETGLKHDRFYFVADWEDENCDLTFTRMIEKMSAMNMKKPDKVINNDVTYLQEIVNNTLADIKTNYENKYQKTPTVKVEEHKSWFKRVFGK